MQYPTEWSSSIVNETLDKSVKKENFSAKPPKNEQHLKTTKIPNKNELKPTFFVQYRGNPTEYVASSMKKLCDIQLIFRTRKLRNCLPTLKLPFDKNLKSHVVYRVTCNACSFINAGQTGRHVTTRISEHQKKDSSVGQHPVECCGTAHNIECEFLDACRGFEG